MVLAPTYIFVGPGIPAVPRTGHFGSTGLVEGHPEHWSLGERPLRYRTFSRFIAKVSFFPEGLVLEKPPKVAKEHVLGDFMTLRRGSSRVP